MIVNADITIFNKKYDAEERTDYFIPTVIRGVSAFTRIGSTIAKGTQTKTNTSTIRIPIDAKCSKSYVDASEYREMETVDDVWTIQTGDFIVLKAVSNTEPTTDVEMSRDYKQIITVQEFTDNTTRGSRNMRHWRIGGV